MPRLFNSTFTTTALNRRSSSRFAAKACTSAARGLLSSQAQLLLAHHQLNFFCVFALESTILMPLAQSDKRGLQLAA
jgi:hypothetical protein